jgi:predicted naringenin-chalcone synthase
LLTRGAEPGLIVTPGFGRKITMPDPLTRLYGLASVPAQHPGPQLEVARFLSNVAREMTDGRGGDRFLRHVDAITKNCGVQNRYSVISDYTSRDPAEFQFYPQNWRLDPFPTTADRMRVYEAEAVELAVRAAEEAIEDARIDRARISHVVITSCTGFFAPGPDVLLIERLGLGRDTSRTVVGFMGCYAGFAAMRLADEIVRAHADGIVLIVSVELCSLHYQRDPTLELLISNALFGDGASALVFARKGASQGGRGDILGAMSRIEPGTRSEMSWRIGDHGFVMKLGSSVPVTLGHGIRPFVRDLFIKAGARRDEIDGWAVHPGGRKIVEEIGRALELTPEESASSRSVLARYGNMSSATIGFVLGAELSRLSSSGRSSGDLALLGFGPGLTMEGAVLRLS